MTWVNKEVWHLWLDETGFKFEIAEFSYEDGEQVRISAVQVAMWLSLWPDAMKLFLSRFKPDMDDIELAKKECTKRHGDEVIEVLRHWITAQEDR